jgi:protein involved in polysaccharide export with SLBB domain
MDDGRGEGLNGPLRTALLVLAAASTALSGTLGAAGAPALAATVTMPRARGVPVCEAPAPAPSAAASLTDAATAASTTTGSTAAAAVPPAPAGVLHPGDKVSVTVYLHPDLTTETTVANDFTIVVPIAGAVSVRNRSLTLIQNDIAAKLDVYLKSPSAVTVKPLSQSNAAYLAGSATGALALKPGDTLVTALTDAKIAPSGDLTRVAILRDGAQLGTFDVRALRAASQPGPLLVSGDVINVPTKPVMVFVTGAVKAPVTAFLDAGEPLGDALAQAQPADDADVEHIRLTRAPLVCFTALASPVMAAPAQPNDALMIDRPANVMVGGSVSKAGKIVLKGDRTLVSALAAAGGPAKDGNLRAIYVTHAGSTAPDPDGPFDLTKLATGDTSGNPALADGDSVYVTQAKPHADPRAIFAAILLAAKKYLKLPS